MKVPMLDVGRQNRPLEVELLAAFQHILGSGQAILGPEVERFERAAAEVAGVAHAIGMSSGTDAILAALMALGIGPGDEVVCPAFTFFATAGSIARVGAKPVFADSLPGCYNIDPSGIEALITPRTRALMPVHLFGQAADMDSILEIARRHKLAVIEDTAQAFGATYKGRPAGSMGEFGTVSFYPSKNLGAIGDAGLLLTNHPGLAKKAFLLRNHGEHIRYHHNIVGGNFRLDAVQAAWLSVKLPHLPEYIAARQRHAAAYDDAFGGLTAGAWVALRPPERYPGRSHIINQYTVRVRPGQLWERAESPRDVLRQYLEQRGIASAVYYPVPLHRQECFQAYGPHSELPVAEKLAGEVLSLPVFPELTEEERAYVIAAVKQFVNS